ncbi:MAG: RIP metalloprotease RseP [Deltaproteobacteria bacterium]|nr:RIP metalloprotease RseP [Deltaproteobacteria bacterium]
MMTILAGILMLGILIFIHELGHFCVAKFMNVKVLKFSLGFGPRLLSRKWGETEYKICAVPLGGYVQMLGEHPEKEDENLELLPADEERSFAAKSPLQRTLIVLAGPVMNLLFPFLLLPWAYLIGVPMPAFLEKPPCIGYVASPSKGMSAGFQAHDCILAVNEKPVSSWEGAEKAILANLGAPLRFTLERDEEKIAVILADPKDGGLEGLQSLGLLPQQDARIGALMPGRAAAKAGMKIGDLILAIDERQIDSWYDIREIVQELKEKPGRYLVDRQGERVEFTIWAEKEERGTASLYLIGIAPLQETVTKRFGLADSIREGASRTWDLIELTFLFIKKLLFGEVSAKNIGGPITVVQLAGHAAQTDFTSILSILAFLSIQLGILNLLPIPILDGGHIFFNFCEMVIRRPLSLRTRELAQQIGLVFLLLLMGLAFYNDLVRLFLGGGSG